MLGQFTWMHPSTWPWFVYVWMAFAAAGVIKPAWIWLRRKQAEDWSIADGRIDHALVTSPRFSFTVRQGHYLAELTYSYTVAGIKYTGNYKNEFPTEVEANEFVRDLQGRAVLVRYSPDKNSSSALRSLDIEVAQKARMPFSASSVPSPTNAVPEWLKPLLWLFITLSGLGVILSIWVHVGALFGQRVAPASFFWMLHIGIFVVWIPAVLIAQRLVGNTNRKDFWKVVLKGSPSWLSYAVYGFFGYALINFLIFMTNAPAHTDGTDTPAEVWRGFSGHWMAFYSAAFAILYTAMKSTKFPPATHRTSVPPYIRPD